MANLRIVAAAAVCAAVLAIGTRASAQSRSEKGAFGLGLIVGEPSGVSAKLYLDDNQAVDAAIGASVIDRGVEAHADYLWHPWILESEDTFVLPVYIGAGLRFLDHDRGRGVANDYHIGARAVAGILFDFRNVPIDVFAELASVLDYRTSGSFGPDISAAAGVRYYF